MFLHLLPCACRISSKQAGRAPPTWGRAPYVLAPRAPAACYPRFCCTLPILPPAHHLTLRPACSTSIYLPEERKDTSAHISYHHMPCRQKEKAHICLYIWPCLLSAALLSLASPAPSFLHPSLLCVPLLLCHCIATSCLSVPHIQTAGQPLCPPTCMQPLTVSFLPSLANVCACNLLLWAWVHSTCWGWNTYDHLTAPAHRTTTHTTLHFFVQTARTGKTRACVGQT